VKGRLLIIVLYVDDLMLTGDDQLIVLQGGPCKRIQDERHGSHALLPWHGSLVEGWGVVYVSGQVCQRDTQEIPHEEVQAHADSSIR